MQEVWGFGKIITGGREGCPNPSDVFGALAVGARDRGITDVTRPSDALDASRDVIIDDVVFGVVGDLRRADQWNIDNDILYVVWDGMPISALR